MPDIELPVLKFEKGRWLLPLAIGAGCLCLWVGIDALSNNVALITGWISFIFSDTLGVLMAKLVGLFALASSAACFALVALASRYKYILTASSSGITFYLPPKPVVIPLNEVDVVRIGRIVTEDIVQKTLVIKSSKTSIVLNGLLLDEPLDLVKDKLNDFLSRARLA